ncbi:MAG TPA: hypothetical protein VFX51_21465 [Solirubrobacteraceae bacterium]|nr:hypothetical protein [Solirubrobacteraceae bacterium]
MTNEDQQTAANTFDGTGGVSVAIFDNELHSLPDLGRYSKENTVVQPHQGTRAVRVLRPDAIPVWLNKPVPSLDHEKPIDLIARGEYRHVADVLAGLETATFS